jgi:hypothetical protein
MTIDSRNLNTFFQYDFISKVVCFKNKSTKNVFNGLVLYESKNSFFVLKSNNKKETQQQNFENFKEPVLILLKKDFFVSFYLKDCDCFSDFFDADLLKFDVEKKFMKKIKININSLIDF